MLCVVFIFTLSLRTDQLLELFEEAPDDQANWGEVIDMDKKLYETDSSSDSDDDVEKELSKKRKQNRPKRKSLRVRLTRKMFVFIGILSLGNFR